MVILANAYFDWVAITRGVTVLLFCIPIVLLCEYEVYRIIYPKQGILRAALTSIYANTISGIAGIFLAESAGEVASRLSGYVFGRESGKGFESILFGILFLLTWLIEAIAIYFFRKKLRTQRVFLGVGLANLVSYFVSAIIFFVFMHNY